MAQIELTINGNQQTLDVDPSMPLLWVLRDVLGLTGTKYGCGEGQCGSCTVHINGQAVRSCITPVSTVAGKTILTIEGLSPDGNHPLQKAWEAEQVPQCGYCQPGQIMTAAALLSHTPSPSDEQISQAMAGVLCRCGTYQRIKKAIQRVVAEGGL
jgi:aerobic-type carbon monoxide dehydrogenase small subunit (CoxS/CutS family)